MYRKLNEEEYIEHAAFAFIVLLDYERYAIVK